MQQDFIRMLAHHSLMETPRQKATRAYLKAVLEHTGWKNPTEIADRAGLAASTINRFLNKADVKHNLSLDTLSKVSAASGLPIPGNVITLAGGNLSEEIRRRLGTPARLADVPAPPSPGSMDKDVPVYGTAEGGRDGSFEMNTGDPIDHVRRPPGVGRTADVYAIYLEGESMLPAIRPGALL